MSTLGHTAGFNFMTTYVYIPPICHSESEEIDTTGNVKQGDQESWK